MSTPLGKRDRALFELMYGSGLRVSEICTLPMTAVDCDDGFARVFGKGSKERIVPVGRHASNAIKNYLHGGRPFLVKDGTGGELFLSMGKQFQEKWSGYWSRIIHARRVLKKFESTWIKAFFCHSSFDGGSGYSGRAGDARTCGYWNDTGVYPNRSGEIVGRTCKFSSDFPKKGLKKQTFFQRAQNKVASRSFDLCLKCVVKVTVFVSPKATVLDPQGAAVEQAMKSLGHQSVGAVRVGKTVTFEIDGEDTPEMRAKLDQLCDGLLSNPVIEDYRFEIENG